MQDYLSLHRRMALHYFLGLKCIMTMLPMPKVKHLLLLKHGISVDMSTNFYSVYLQMKKFTNISNFCTFFEHLHCHDCQFKKQWKLNLLWRLLHSVPDPGFPPGGGVNPQGRGANIQFCQIFQRTA